MKNKNITAHISAFYPSPCGDPTSVAVSINEGEPVHFPLHNLHEDRDVLIGALGAVFDLIDYAILHTSEDANIEKISFDWPVYKTLFCDGN